MCSTLKLTLCLYGPPLRDTHTHQHTGIHTADKTARINTKQHLRVGPTPREFLCLLSLWLNVVRNNPEHRPQMEKGSFLPIDSIVRYVLIATKKNDKSLVQFSGLVYLFEWSFLLHGLLVVVEFMLEKQRKVSVLLTSIQEKPDCDLNQRCLNHMLRGWGGVLGWTDTGVWKLILILSLWSCS